MKSSLPTRTSAPKVSTLAFSPPVSSPAHRSTAELSTRLPRRLRSGERYYLAPLLLEGGDVVSVVALAASEARAARAIQEAVPRSRALALPRACVLNEVRRLHTLHGYVASTPS